MKNQWWWNGSFEDLMANLTEWLEANPDITIQHMDWKHVARPDEGQGYWYMIVLYR